MNHIMKTFIGRGGRAQRVLDLDRGHIHAPADVSMLGRLQGGFGCWREKSILRKSNVGHSVAVRASLSALFVYVCERGRERGEVLIHRTVSIVCECGNHGTCCCEFAMTPV
jgi:hypothetical protein